MGMRLISQNGNVDVPYEEVIVTHEISFDRHVVMARNFDKVPSMIMAEYDSPEKVEKAMELMRTKYESYIHAGGGPSATMDAYVPFFAFNPPKAFRFPANEEVEVR